MHHPTDLASLPVIDVWGDTVPHAIGRPKAFRRDLGDNAAKPQAGPRHASSSERSDPRPNQEGSCANEASNHVGSR